MTRHWQQTVNKHCRQHTTTNDESWNMTSLIQKLFKKSLIESLCYTRYKFKTCCHAVAESFSLMNSGNNNLPVWTLFLIRHGGWYDVMVGGVAKFLMHYALNVLCLWFCCACFNKLLFMYCRKIYTTFIFSKTNKLPCKEALQFKLILGVNTKRNKRHIK